MKKRLQRVHAWSKRDDVRASLTATILVATLAIYGLIFYLGHRPLPLPAPGIPLFLRFHPERLFACGASVFAMFTLRRRLQEEQPLLEPLSWMFLASVVHLSSLAIEFHWV